MKGEPAWPRWSSTTGSTGPSCIAGSLPACPTTRARSSSVFARNSTSPRLSSKRTVDWSTKDFDPDVVGEEIYFDDRSQQAYVRLDARLLARIETGLVRL